MLDATVGADPADPITAEGAAHIPKSYRDALDADGLKGARIGVLRALWGTAPEDDEVAGIVRKALDGFKAQGAEVVDISVPGLDDLLRDSSVIGDEFKFDLAAYLAKMPNAPVKSLGEILDRGLQSRRARRDVPPAQPAGEARDRALSAGDDQAPRAARRGAGDARGTAHRRARLSDAAPQAGADRRSAGRHQLPAERDDGTAGDRDAGRLQHRRPADRARAARRRVGRGEAVEVRVSRGSRRPSRGGRRSARRRW